MSLEQLRKELTRLDRELLDVVARRQRLVAAIGDVKRSAGLPTRDYAREKAVLESAARTATRLGVAPALAQQLLTMLIRSSLTAQERNLVAAGGRGHGERALVLGGAGKMGRWFVRFLDSQGFVVTVADPAGGVDGYAQTEDWREAARDAELVVVAAPLRVTGGILHELAAIGPRGLVFDIGSLKTPLRDGLQALATAGCRVTSVHPMFGPDTELLSGRHVIFVEAGHKEATAEARALFAATMAQQVAMSLDEHDRLIAHVLGLAHALNIAFFTALQASGEDVPRLAEISSTTFDAQLDVAARVAEENPHLYFEIQSQNPAGLEVLGSLAEAVDRLTGLVSNGDEAGFVAMMERGRAYLEGRRQRG